MVQIDAKGWLDAEGWEFCYAWLVERTAAAPPSSWETLSERDPNRGVA